jgi:hypothetical protein
MPRCETEYPQDAAVRDRVSSGCRTCVCIPRIEPLHVRAHLALSVSMPCPLCEHPLPSL